MLILPVLIVLMFTLLQVGLYFHASNVVRVAAEEGAHAARVENGSAAAGRARALDVINSANAGGLLDGLDVRPARTTLWAEVSVSATVPNPFPLPFNLRVEHVAEGPVERFTNWSDT